MFYSAILLILMFVIILTLLPAWILSRRPPRWILLSVKNQEESIEARVRLLLLRYPCAEIYVQDRASNDETPQILARLAQDCPRVHFLQMEE